MSTHASVAIEDGIATITLDDGKANAFGFAMMEAINACLDEAEEKADVIVLTGRPGITCAGFDLKVMRETPKEASKMVKLGGELLLRLFATPKPLIIAASGHGIAAGGLLMLTSDYRIGLQGDARFGLNESAIGMVLPPFGIELARFKLDNRKLDASAVNAELFLPDAAIDVGFLDEVCTEADFAARVSEKAKQLQELDSRALAGNKKLIRGATIEKIAAGLQSGDGMQVV